MKNLICKVSSLKIKVFVLLVVLIFTNIPASFAADDLDKKEEWRYDPFIAENRKKYALLRTEASFYDKIINVKNCIVPNPNVFTQRLMRFYLVPWKDLLKHITWNYVKDLILKGEKFDEKELAKRIKHFAHASNILKKRAKDDKDRVDREMANLNREYTVLLEEWRGTRKEEVVESKEEKSWQDDFFDITPMGEKDREMFGGGAGPTPGEKK